MKKETREKNTEKLMQSLKKGIEQGYGENHVVEQLLKRGYKKGDIDYALLVLKNPEIEKEEQVSKEDIELSRQKAKLHPYDELILQKKEKNIKKNPFESLKEPAILYFTLSLCVIFFIIGMIAGKIFF